MAIKYLSGNRTYGTAAEIPTIGGVTGWTELGRTTLSSAGDTIDVTINNAADYPYLMILQQTFPSSTSIQERTRVNSDSGSNYASRQSISGGSDFTNTNRNNGYEYGDGQNHPNNFSVTYVNNIADQEKLAIHHWIGADTGAGTAPIRAESVGKWANTSDLITTWNAYNANSSADFAAGSEVVILGSNPSGGGSTTAWQELADVELTGTASVIDSGTITAKKYLWIQFFKVSSGDSNFYLEFNSDTASNYARRYSGNGGSDGTNTSAAYLMPAQSGGDYDVLFNGFIVNKSDKEKLLTGETANANAEDSANAPMRREVVGKWANTSSQITNIKIKTATNNFASGTRMVVWGFD